MTALAPLLREVEVERIGLEAVHSIDGIGQTLSFDGIRRKSPFALVVSRTHSDVLEVLRRRF